MITKDMFLEVVGRETGVARHLGGKVPAGQLDYRPGPNMRTTLELMQYLSYCVINPAEAIVSGDWSKSGTWAPAAASMKAEEFPARMEQQLARFEKLLASLTDAEMETRDVKLPWGETMKLGAAFLMVLRFLTAYRMQLFVYAKASGAPQLNTYNAWMGMDPPPQAASPAKA